mmetsp:Transcript_3111/g.4797  ORF Transcript_3111/g.4797 Transcript_3111/m.4797 type:complete len:325 (+) Transcript_3111:66-1040(+)
MMSLSRISAAASVAVTMGAFRWRNVECESESRNSAFVFIKPHANTPKTQQLVSRSFSTQGIRVLEEGELTGEQIDQGRLIDQHYYAIASKATLMKPEQLPVPAAKFQDTFGISWQKALKDGLVFNALDACKHLGITADELDKAWGPAKKVKFGGGFYCGLVSVPGKTPIYVFNGFFMSMRNKFVTPGTSIHYYVVDFSPSDISWSDFRGNVLGPTDPAQAPADSLRGKILKDWKSLGLEYQPNVGDNGVHASASPFEGLAERANWLKTDIAADPFGAKLLAAGISRDTIEKWSVDPQVKGKSLFDSLEDLDTEECVAKAVELNK